MECAPGTVKAKSIALPVRDTQPPMASLDTSCPCLWGIAWNSHKGRHREGSSKAVSGISEMVEMVKLTSHQINGGQRGILSVLSI